MGLSHMYAFSLAEGMHTNNHFRSSTDMGSQQHTKWEPPHIYIVIIITAFVFLLVLMSMHTLLLYRNFEVIWPYSLVILFCLIKILLVNNNRLQILVLTASYRLQD